ncbi:MAG TPA: hypothetical protein VFO91_10270 [Anaerolineales bacterium]|nr:hypothetical protein [Anaerolineales bacterium]
MSTDASDEITARLEAMVEQVLDINQYDPADIARIWTQQVNLEKVMGVVGIVEMDPEAYLAVLNLPVVVMPVYGKILSLGDVMQLLTAVSEMPGAQFALKDSTVFLTLCLPLESFREESIDTIIRVMLNGADEVRTALRAAIRNYYQIQPPEESTYPEPDLPNIKMTPREMQIIYSILSRCKPDVQKVFTLLMEKWDKSGYIVATTPASIVLDLPYGRRPVHLAMLFPGVSEGLAALQPAMHAHPPAIALPWDSLRKFKGFPQESVDLYQKKVGKMAALRLTGSSAHIEMNGQFDVRAASVLLKAMRTLAKSLQPELVEGKEPAAPVTPDNIEATLASCSEHVRAVFRDLIENWMAAGGTVQSPRSGRVYLKMKTKAHRSGRRSQIPRKFNLVVLAGARGRKPAHIQVEWDLSRSESAAYLDCIPDEVARFEKTVASLPGFERKGTITYLWIDEEFQRSHLQLLSEAIVRVKQAERAAL